MCYSPAASIFSVLTGAVSCAVLYKTFDRAIAAFVAFTVLMQLYDYVFWTVGRSDLNFWVTKLAMVTNNLQPVALAAAIALLRLGPGERLKTASVVALALYVFVATWYTARSWSRVKWTEVDPVRSPGSLYWAWNYQPGYVLMYTAYMVTVVLLLTQHYPWPINGGLVALTLASFAFSFAYFKGKTAGRMWCWMGGFAPLAVMAMFWVMDRR
jgi:hypothetical protein